MPQLSAEPRYAFSVVKKSQNIIALKYQHNVSCSLCAIKRNRTQTRVRTQRKKEFARAAAVLKNILEKCDFSKLLVGALCTSKVKNNTAWKWVGMPRLLFLFIFWDGFAVTEHARGSKGMLHFPPRATLRRAKAGAGNAPRARRGPSLQLMVPGSFHPTHLLSLRSF